VVVTSTETASTPDQRSSQNSAESAGQLEFGVRIRQSGMDLREGRRTITTAFITTLLQIDLYSSSPSSGLFFGFRVFSDLDVRSK
jgi:hypothetical protein